MTQSKSSLCINGSHVYESEPSTPKSSAAHPSKLVLLEKCSPLSRSLQNLTKRGEDKGSFAEGRRWSFDKTKKEEKEGQKEAQASSSTAQQAQTGGQPVQAVMPGAVSGAGSPDKGRKLRMTLFSGGRSDSLPAKSDLNQAAPTSEGRLKGWFGSGDSQNKPRWVGVINRLVFGLHSVWRMHFLSIGTHGRLEFTVCSAYLKMDLLFLHFPTTLHHYLTLYVFPQMALQHFHFLHQCVSTFLLYGRCNITVVLDQTLPLKDVQKIIPRWYELTQQNSCQCRSWLVLSGYNALFIFLLRLIMLRNDAFASLINFVLPFS